MTIENLNFKKIKDYSLFQTKVLLKNKAFYLLLIVPLIFILTTMTIGTMEIFYMGVFSGTFLISTLFVYRFFDNDAEIFKRLNISKLEKNLSAFMVSLFFNCVLFIFITSYFIFFLTFLHILNQNGQGLFFQNWNYRFSLVGIAWGIVSYYLLFFTLMAYSFYFLLSSIFQNQKSFFLFSVSYIIFTIFFGGVIGSFFDYKIDFQTSNFLLREVYLEPELQSNLNFLFYFSNLFSFFFLNQFVYLMFLNVNFVFSNNMGFLVLFNFFRFYNFYWLFLIILPYVWVMFYFGMGFWINKKRSYNI